MANNNQSIEQPVSTSVNPTASIIEPMILADEQKLSRKNRRFSSSANKIFAISLFILLIVLISYILFHGKVTDTKLSRLANNADLNSNDIKKTFEEINRTLKSIELILITQSKKSNIDIVLNGKDLHDFYSNQTVLYNFLQKIREQL
jgi:hypothetical protein